RLVTQPNTILVRFSSWLPGDERNLVASLFSSVTQELKRAYVAHDINKSFLKFARLIMTSLPKAPRSFQNSLVDESQEEQIRHLRDHIARIRKRIVVLMDEVDRMQAEELNAAFKILRGVPDFKNFRFVCALHSDAL